MNISPDCPVSLTPAQPGWIMRQTSKDGEGFDYPIVAWAVIALCADDEGRIGTEVQPVFIVNGMAWTTIEWSNNISDDNHLAVMEP